jgi:nucleoporin NUP82
LLGTAKIDELLTFESIETMAPQVQKLVFKYAWPTFTMDCYSPYSFYVTHPAGVLYLSLLPWTERLEGELHSQDAGVDFRVNLFTQGAGTLREKILDIQPVDEPSANISSTIVFDDVELDHFLLAAAPDQPVAAILELAEGRGLDSQDADNNTESKEEAQEYMKKLQPRPTYQPSQAFWQETGLSKFVANNVQARHKKLVHEKIRLTPQTLELMVKAHRLLSHETNQLNIAAAELHSRCQRLLQEFKEQISLTRDLSDKIDNVTGAEDEDEYYNTQRGNPEERLESAKSRQQNLTSRYDNLLKKLGNYNSGKDLSESEKLWIKEVEKLKQRLLKTDADGDSEGDIVSRYHQAQDLGKDLLMQARSEEKRSEPDNQASSMRVPSHVRKQKAQEVGEMLEREYVVPFPTLFIACIYK